HMTVIFANSQTAKITTVDYKQQLINYPTLSEPGRAAPGTAPAPLVRPDRARPHPWSGESRPRTGQSEP
ncbi:hypothetical protein, partial [Streptomyces sp. NPDC005805]|uniref:hypothetical protein n=1 Tax=Streptomyces sp. NPDC005805 TaxID=3157068 RepID=UPI0033F3657F